jgi:hypothetical protein
MPKDTEREIDELHNRLWMERPLQDRAKAMFGMFSMARRAVIASLPKDLSDRELKEAVYFRTYGERLPDDFFDQEKA